ncbi:MAG: asparagine synthase-related protein [Acidilobaceae archaeon]
MSSKCVEYKVRIVDAVSREASKCECTLLSGGIDTSLIALVHPYKELVKAITVDMGGSDVNYASIAASKLKLGSHIVHRPPIEEFLRAIDWVLENIKTIDPIEVSADAVHYISLSMAKSIGCQCILSGDGGDELFAGYTFLYNKPEEYIREWIRDKAKYSWLPTVHIGRLIGLNVYTPLYTDEVKEIALEIPVNCLTSSLNGKIILREILREYGLVEIADRPKTPINTGSGSQTTLKNIVEAVKEDLELTVSRRLGFKPPSKAHAWLAYRLISLKVEPPPRVEGYNACPICGRGIIRGYCRFCGTCIDSRGIVYHYSGD